MPNIKCFKKESEVLFGIEEPKRERRPRDILVNFEFMFLVKAKVG